MVALQLLYVSEYSYGGHATNERLSQVVCATNLRPSWDKISNYNVICVNHSLTSCDVVWQLKAALHLSCDLETSPENRKPEKWTWWKYSKGRCDSLATLRFVNRPFRYRTKLSENVVVDRCMAAAQLMWISLKVYLKHARHNHPGKMRYVIMLCYIYFENHREPLHKGNYTTKCSFLDNNISVSHYRFAKWGLECLFQTNDSRRHPRSCWVYQAIKIISKNGQRHWHMRRCLIISDWQLFSHFFTFFSTNNLLFNYLGF